jgi:hypothetical protein
VQLRSVPKGLQVPAVDEVQVAGVDRQLAALKPWVGTVQGEREGGSGGDVEFASGNRYAGYHGAGDSL